MREPRRKTGCGMVLLAVACLLGGCAQDGWRRLLFDIGDQYACQQRGAHQATAVARAGQCADTGHADRGRYANYRAAREQALSQRQ